MQILEVIKASLRKLGVLSSGETPEVARQTEALQALQLMLRSWAQQRIYVYASTKDSLVLTPGKLLYSWGGVGADITTSRPHEVLGAVLKDVNGLEYPVGLLSADSYREIPNKTSGGRPYLLFFHPSFPAATISLYPVPTSSEVLEISSLKAFTEASNFATLADTLSFPVNYYEPIVYNLALRLAPEYGVMVSGEVVVTARDGLDALAHLNAANQVEPIRLSFPADRVYGRFVG